MALAQLPTLSLPTTFINACACTGYVRLLHQAWEFAANEEEAAAVAKAAKKDSAEGNAALAALAANKRATQRRKEVR